MLQRPFNWRSASIHTIYWLLYILYEQLSVRVVMDTYELTFGTIYFYIINILAFYSQAIVLQRFLGAGTQRYCSAAIFMAVTLVFILVLKIAGELVIDHGLNGLTKPGTVSGKTITLDLLRTVLYMVLGTTYWTIVYNQRLRKAAADEEIARLQMVNLNADLQIRLSNVENAYLRQQINPHLLFNALNFVYSTVHQHSRDGAHAVYLLTELLGFSLSKADHEGQTELSAEIEQINNLITLNRYRFDFDLPLELRITGNPVGHRIIPLILLTLVENMFVHGILKEEPAALMLEISENGLLNFTTKNASTAKSAKTGLGTGLNNIRTRLEHSYPGRFKLTVQEQGHQFFTHLIIQLTL